MAKKEKTETVEKTVEKPIVDETVGKLKVKKKPKMKKLNQDNNEPIKIDLSKSPKKQEDV